MAAAPHLDFERDIVEIQGQIEKLLELADNKGLDVSSDLALLRSKLEAIKLDTYRNLRPIEQVQVARHPKRPYTLDYIDLVFTDWLELHGDRAFRDDEAIVGGWARLGGRSVMVIGHQKGRDMKENLRRNFGMPHPEGYRKALRLMRMADKFGRPVVIGEGGSGGALALGVTDRILMLEHSVYSVISPEGCAAILWRSAEHREKAADALKMTSANLHRLGICDEVIAEPAGGAHSDPKATAETLAAAVTRHLDELEAMKPEERLRQRHAKYADMGAWLGDDDHGKK
jgi:acetyl-CoA carboxylase carboxyl transferase subunit alpha